MEHKTEICMYCKEAVSDIMDLTVSTSMQSLLSNQLNFDLFKLHNRLLLYYHQIEYQDRKKLVHYLHVFYSILDEEFFHR